MKFKWKYDYVPKGQMTPDEYGRWGISCYIFVNIDKALPKYKWVKKDFKQDNILVRVATIQQKGTSGAVVPSTVNRFCACIPSFEDAGNTGLSNQRYFYSNDIDDLKKQVEKEFRHIQKVFKNCA